MKAVMFSPRAKIDAHEAQAWHEERETGLGAEFSESLERSLEIMQKSPETPRRFQAGYRKILLHRFPYHVVYEVQLDCIWVLAVLDARRNPATLRKRLRGK